jgi:hypothetical protein
MMSDDRPAQIVPSSQGVQTTLCWRRVAFAALFTPLLAPFYAAVLFGHPWALPIGLMLSYPAASLIGLPTLALLARNKRRIGYWQCVAIGMLCSLPAIIAYDCFDLPTDLQIFDFAGALSLIAWGAFSGFCFWLLGIAGDSPVTLRTIMTAGSIFERNTT